MTSAKSSQRGRIIIWRLFGLETGSRSEKLPRHQGGSCGYSHAVQKIAAGDTALHSQLAVVVFAHWAPETSECCDGPLSVGFLYCSSAPWKPILLCVPSQKGLLMEPPQRQSEKAGLPVRSYGVPFASTNSTEPSGASTRNGPLGRTVIFTCAIV